MVAGEAPLVLRVANDAVHAQRNPNWSLLDYTGVRLEGEEVTS